MKTLTGPVNLSTNHDCGVLVEGFEFPPAMMMPYNYRYYGSLLEGWGLKKMRDLYAYDISAAMTPPEKMVRIAERLKESEQVRVRPLNIHDLPEEIRRLKSIYNAMLDRNWLFLPMNEEEFDSITARLRPLVRVRPELCLIAEVKGEPVAFCITLPDSNVAIREAGGQLTRWGFPVGLAKMAWAARRIERLRVLLFGIKPGYRRRGLDALLGLETLRAARRLGYDGAELGWTTEDNELMNRAIESIGARRYKTYRIYEKPAVGRVRDREAQRSDSASLRPGRRRARPCSRCNLLARPALGSTVAFPVRLRASAARPCGTSPTCTSPSTTSRWCWSRPRWSSSRWRPAQVAPGAPDRHRGGVGRRGLFAAGLLFHRRRGG